MQKSYLEFELKKTFGVICSHHCNVLFDSTGKLAYTGALERISVWYLRQGQLNTSIGESANSKNNAAISRICLTPDGLQLIAGYTDGSIKIWDLKTESLVSTFTGHKSEITALCYVQSLGYVISGSKDTDIYVWDVMNEQGLFKLRGHKNVVTQLKFLEKSKTIVSASKDNLLKFWDFQTKHCVQTVTGHPSEIWSFDINPEETKLITICNDNELRVYKLLSPDLLTPVEPEPTAENNDNSLDSFKRAEYWGSLVRKSNEKGSFVKFTMDGSLLGVQAGKTLEIFEVNDEEVILKKVQRRRQRENQKKRQQLQQAPAQGEEMEEEDPALGEGKEENEPQEGERGGKAAEAVPSDEYSPKQILRTDVKIVSFDFIHEKRGKEIVVTLANNTIELFRRKRQALEKLSSINIPGHRSDVRSVAFSSRDEMLFSASSSEAKIWNVHSSSCIRTMEIDYPLTGLFAPGDKHVVVGTKSGHVELYDLHSATCVESNNKIHSNSVFTLQLNPNKTGFFSGGSDKILASWEFELVQNEENPLNKRLTIQCVNSMEMPDGIFAIKFSPNGKFIAVALMDNTIRIYFVDSMKLYLTLYGHKLPVLTIDFSSDSTLLISGSADKNVSIWGVDFGDCHKSLFAHQDSVMQVLFVKDTHYFFSCGKDGMIKYWDADKFEHIMTLEGHHNEIWSIALSSEGNLLASAGQDRSIRFWRQTETQIFLDSKKQKEIEEAWDKDMEFEEERTMQLDDKEVGSTIRPSIENIKQGERILEALDLIESEIAIQQLYLKDLEKARSEATPEILKEYDSQNKPLVVPPEPNVLLLGKSHSEYLLWVISRIKPSNLESALSILPFGHVLMLLKFVDDWVKQHKELIMCCRILFFLLRKNQTQISVNRILLNTLSSLRNNLHHYLQQHKDIIDFNMASMNFLKSQIELNDNSKDFYEVAEKLQELKQKKAKKAPVPYWLQKSSDSE